MNIRDVDPAGQPISNEEAPSVSEYNVDAPALPELEMKAVAQVMDVDEDGIYKDKLRTLIEWAKQQSSDHSLENLKWIVRSLELKLGTPPLSEKRINYVARYAYLLTQEKEIVKEKNQLEGKPDATV